MSRQRHERRMRDRQFKELTTKRDRLREQLRGVEVQVLENRQEMLSIIEEYVNASAKALDVDEQAGSPAWKDDRELYELVANHRWRGAETPEQAKIELENEVARRSVGKTDLAVLLNSIDHTAINLYRTLPDSLKVYEGEALVEAIVERLRQEDFTADLMKDKAWADMRVRWIRLGWRCTTEETFSEAFVRACAERMVEFHTSPMHDIVLDAELAKLSPVAKAKMVHGFHQRLVREYMLLPKDGDKRYGEVLGQMRGGETEVEALRSAGAIGMDMFTETSRDPSVSVLSADMRLRILESLGGDTRRLDFAMLLSTVDHVAIGIHQSGPSWLKEVGRKRLADVIVDSLTAGGYLKNMHNKVGNEVGDPLMRDRWIEMGWRGVTAQTLNETILRAAAERYVEVSERSESKLGAFTMRDTILAEILEPASSEEQDAMIAAFRERFEREYAVLGSEASGGVAARDDINFIESPLLRATDEDKPDNWLTQYSDHGLMRAGRVIWEKTYAVGADDDHVRARFAGHEDEHGARMSMFSAKWAVHAFQRLMTSHTFASALMCSDFPRESLEGIEKQWDAFVVVVPNGMLTMDGYEFSRILVATYSYGANMILLSVSPADGVRAPFIEASSLPHLLACDESELDGAETRLRRCLIMARRLVAGLLLHLQHTTNFKVRKVEARAKHKGREAEPEHRIVSIGKPLEVDCRAEIKDYIEHGPRKGRKNSPPTVQVLVRGHPKRQVYGVGRLQRKEIWIEPYWRGPEAALIQTRAAKVKS